MEIGENLTKVLLIAFMVGLLVVLLYLGINGDVVTTVLAIIAFLVGFGTGKTIHLS